MQQLASLPYEGVQQVLGLFMKSSSFTRYLLDDILPKEVFNNRKIVEEDLDKVLEECEALMVSLKTFKQLYRFLNLSRANSNSTQSLQKDCARDNGLVPIKLVKSFQSLSDILKSTNDLQKFQLFYCELCDESSHIMNNENYQHFVSERHISGTFSSSKTLSTHHCKSCGLFMMASQSVLNNILNAEIHVNLDKTLENLKLNSDNNKIKNNDVEDSYAASEISESMISEYSNRNDEVVEDKDKFNSNCNGNTSRRFKDKWSMTDLFIELNDCVYSGKIKYCIYCRPCNQALTALEEWNSHKQSREHLNNMKGAKNYFEKCFNCPFHVFSQKPALNAYLRYHKEINHSQRNKINKSDSKKNKSDSKIFTNDNHSSRNNNSNSCENRKKNNSHSREVPNACRKKEQPVLNDLSSTQQSSSIEYELNRTYKIEPLEKYKDIDTDKNSIKNNSSLSLFLKIINLQKKMFLDCNYYSPKGVCLLCSAIIEDEYDWIAHVKTKHKPKEGEIEDACKKCKLFIYGPAEVIEKELWNVKDHHDLDMLLS